MGKLQSLERLYELGFNTPKLLCSLPQFLSSRDKISLWGSVETTPGIKLSIRTERDGEKVCPHYPNITRPMANKRIKQLSSQGYEIHIFEGIDPADCLRRGTLCDTGSKIIIEYLEGPGTVRDLEHNPVEHIELQEGVVIPETLRPIITDVTTQRVLQGQILEWSIYNKPVGRFHRPDIFWEIRAWR